MLHFRVIVMGGDGTVCEVLNTAVMKQQGSNITDLKPINISIGVIPTGRCRSNISLYMS